MDQLTRTLLTSYRYKKPLGTEWVIRESGTTADLEWVGWVGGAYLSAGYQWISQTPHLVRSTDYGASWTPQPCPGRIRGMTNWGSLLVAVGDDGGGGNGRIWTTSDLQNWTTRLAGGPALHAVVNAGAGLVAGGYNTLWNSPDAVNWSIAPKTWAGNFDTSAMEYHGGQIIAVARATWGLQEPAIMTSPQGTTWTVRATGSYLQAVAAHNQSYLAVGAAPGGGQNMRSSTYSQSASVWDFPSGTGVGMTGVLGYARDGDLFTTEFVTVGSGTIFTGRPGAWQQRSSHGRAVRSVGSNGITLVAVGAGGAILTSQKASP